MRRLVLLAMTVACAMGAGCHREKPVSDAEQIRTALNSFYATEPACLWTSPVTLDHSKSLPTKQARALEDAGLIDTERHGYKLTNAGRPFWREDPARRGFGNLCFGRWRVSRIVSMKTRQEDLLSAATETTFDAAIVSPALWTRVPAMQVAFPLMAQEVSQPLPHSAVMKHTDKGWQVAVIAVPTPQ